MAGRRERESEQDKKLFVGGLHYETSESKLRAFYEKWGEVVDCVVMMDPHTKRSRGFGFVTYGSMDSVEDALNSRPHIIDGKEVEPKRATPREESSRSDSRGGIKKVFVGGIGQDTDEFHLRDYFSKYGLVENASIMTDKDTGKSRGFGFVVFEDYEPADRCSATRWHEINSHRCEVKKAVPRQDESLQRGRDSGRSRSSYGGERSSYGGGRSGYGAGSYSGLYGGGYGSSAYGSYAAYASAYPGYGSSGWSASDSYPAGAYASSSLGSAYGSSYGGGPMKSSGYSSRSSGPYGGSYGSSSGGYGSSYSGASSAPYASSSSAYHGSASAYGSPYGASHAYSAYGGY